MSFTVLGSSGRWNGIRMTIPGSTSIAPFPGEIAALLIHVLSRSAFTVSTKSAVSLAPPWLIVAVMVTKASLSVGTVTPPEIERIAGALDSQVMPLPFTPEVGRKIFPVTLEAESPGP